MRGSGLGEHTIVPDDRRFELLWLVDAAVLPAAPEGGKGLEARNRFRAVLDQVENVPSLSLSTR
jgi:hypothetical protein